MKDWIKGAPKKRGEYLCYQPASTVMGTDVAARVCVLYWNGNKWRSSLSVTHYAILPAPPED